MAIDLSAAVTDAIRADLLQTAREERVEWVVLVSSDNRLIPVVKFLQSKGTRIVHGSVLGRARDLSLACDTSVDLGAHLSEFHGEAGGEIGGEVGGEIGSGAGEPSPPLRPDRAPSA
jgi:hypothetical protein